MAELDLNDRQRQAVALLKVRRQIANRDYQELTGATARTATRDLGDLADKGLLRKVGSTGRGAHYVLVTKRDMNRTNETPLAPMT